MRILVLGASKGTGLETVKAALKKGFYVRAFARTAMDMSLESELLEKFKGDALNLDHLNESLQDVDAVVQTLGIPFSQLLKPTGLFSKSTELLVSAMESGRPKRLVTLTGFGAGDSKAKISPLQKLPFELMFGRAYADKSVQEHIIRQSKLNWTLVRPGVLRNGKATNTYKILTDPQTWRNGLIRRADVAEFMVANLNTEKYWNQAVVLVS